MKFPSAWANAQYRFPGGFVLQKLKENVKLLYHFFSLMVAVSNLFLVFDFQKEHFICQCSPKSAYFALKLGEKKSLKIEWTPPEAEPQTLAAGPLH